MWPKCYAQNTFVSIFLLILFVHRLISRHVIILFVFNYLVSFRVHLLECLFATAIFFYLTVLFYFEIMHLTQLVCWDVLHLFFFIYYYLTNYKAIFNKIWTLNLLFLVHLID